MKSNVCYKCFDLLAFLLWEFSMNFELAYRNLYDPPLV